MLIHKAVLICDVCGNWLSECEISSGTLDKDYIGIVKKKNKKLKCKITLQGRVVCKECLTTENRSPNWSKK